MTPTEQDKELRDLLIEIKFNIRKGDKVGDVPVAHIPHIAQDIDTYLKSDDAARVIELITADRKRVALEARIDELTKLRRMFERLAEYADDKEWVMFEYDDRIATLKAQQDEV